MLDKASALAQVCFGPLQQELLLYRYTGLCYPTPGEATGVGVSAPAVASRTLHGPLHGPAAVAGSAADRVPAAGAEASAAETSNTAGAGGSAGRLRSGDGLSVGAAIVAAAAASLPAGRPSDSSAEMPSAAAAPASAAEAATEAVVAAGPSTPEEGSAAAATLPANAAQFDSHFQLQWRRRLVSHPQMLCKDAMLVRLEGGGLGNSGKLWRRGRGRRY